MPNQMKPKVTRSDIILYLYLVIFFTVLARFVATLCLICTQSPDLSSSDKTNVVNKRVREVNRFFCDHWIDSFWDVNWKQDGSTRWLDPRRRIHSRHISCMPRKWNAVYSLRHHSGELNGCRTESVNRSGCGVDSWGWLFTFSSPGISESILCGIDWRGNWKSGWRRHDLAHNAVQANWFEFWFADRRRSPRDNLCTIRSIRVPFETNEQKRTQIISYETSTQILNSQLFTFLSVKWEIWARFIDTHKGHQQGAI